MVAVLASGLSIVSAPAQPAMAEEGLPDEPQMPGRLEGTGTHFELTDSQYLNITLDSSQPIKLVLESVPEMVTMQLESAADATSTEIALSGFLASTTYHKYEDDYHNHLAFTTDADGKYTYTQDLAQAHLVFIQPRSSTIFLGDSGWSKPVGTWDPVTKTGTLTQDVTETIQIDSNNVTLDGNGHTATGTLTGYGVYLNSKTGVTIKNLNVTQFTYGIYLYYSSSNTLNSNTASSNTVYGIYLYDASNNKIYNNNFINNPTQAYVSGGSGNVFNLAKPTGGNYWDNWTSPDADGDGFVDLPYVFTSGHDYLPWTRQNGWLDNIPPTTTISLSGTLGSNGWYISTVEATLTATDNPGGSGVKKTKYSFDGSSWIPYTAPLTVSDEGSTTIYYCSIDNQDNVEATNTETINIDKTPPVISSNA